MKANYLKQMVLGLDLKNYNLKILKPNRKQKECNFDLVPFDKNLFLDGNYFQIFDSCLKKYFETNVLDNQHTIVVLPDCFLGMDFVNVPALSKSKIIEVLGLELSSLYNFEKLEINNEAIEANKNNYVFQVNYLNKQIKEDIYKSLMTNRLMPDAITFESCSITNFVLANGLNSRVQNFAFVDIQNGKTNLALCREGKIAGYTNWDFGFEIMDSTQLLNEKDLMNNNNAVNLVNEVNKSLKATNTLNIKKQKPQTENEFVMANFELFEKRILFAIKEAKESNALTTVETIFINLPPKFNFIVDNLNQTNNIFKLCNFDDKTETLIKHNMDLFGASYCKNFNTNMLF